MLVCTFLFYTVASTLLIEMFAPRACILLSQINALEYPEAGKSETWKQRKCSLVYVTAKVLLIHKGFPALSHILED